MINLTARSMAVQMLTRVEVEGAYANLLLQNNIGRLTDSRDRQFVTLLVNGTLKHRLTLDYALRRYLSKPMSVLPHEVRAILRIGAFQLLYADRVPPAVAVNESVELAKGYPKYTGLVNVVLRKVMSTAWEFPWPDSKRETVRYLSVRYSHPEWMIQRWLKRWGQEETEALCIANNEPAHTWIRTNTLKISRENLRDRLIEEGITVELGTRIPESLKIQNFSALDRLESFKEGLFTVQDESSQLVAHVLNPQPGQHVLDACSAPGGKATHLAQLMEDKGEILAFDIHSHKLDLIQQLTQRLGIKIIQPQLGDARDLPGVRLGSQQRVLVDAPCSGLGVLRRRADLRWQREEEDLKEFPTLQLAILERAASCVDVGGDLVYSTCTTEPEENFELVKRFRSGHPEFEPVNLAESLPFELENPRDIQQANKGMLQILPNRHEMDGFFLAKFRRTS
ncbi:16S rRNA (cytosine(967)-C(5))-methyltransferase RsmB [Desulfosporosinus sp. BICA1-9]|uniref:16S rRNA (cytosine(967)-C(5))-methyltransferase RsmB n=1 Tax=Desulfosporosinus sp. BICA1-9 TaxID=1531958 RepID=UPI00054C3C74|nr:16S rRNA (cytosine(967)-C(5))-methyltransferase RsmB [Desulfosporosinus sp. BICA1-9]KJS48702.1 MAG: 16S rRNA methyltransferase [Peptococcaceae bacterium BRH_c23]KJS90476.1 MAG: 16S rRNA methyltransferase [Desulfosporosinus sp. BICA1-9]HBW38439.1 16S rRNA (cytosine(967)-C(5))-methyltransferase RsmB [Desulfosporosinus sp.]